MTDLNPKYWNDRYRSNEIGWDIGYPSPAITKYIDKLEDPFTRILIPGCGNAYEGEYIWEAGFDNLFLLDYAEKSKENFLRRVPDFPEEQFLVGDFFELEGKFDLIIEQTFFCALNPELRPNYAKKMHELLSPEGKLIGLLFNDPLNTDTPPFGGNALEYLGYFNPYFSKVKMTPCKNSIQPRTGRELFINISKKK